jgi:hypothetical protein
MKKELVRIIEDICQDHLDNINIDDVAKCEDHHDHYLLGKWDMAQEIMESIITSERVNNEKRA